VDWPEKKTAVKPFLKWAGGKRQLLPEIRNYLPRDPDITYYEPFAGAGAVLFDLLPRKAVIGDSNAELMMCYRVIRDDAEGLIRALKVHAEKNNRDYYYEVRSLDRDPAVFRRMTETERAARVIYLNKTCYNGLYRVNARGLFNVPRGRYQDPAICEEDALRAVHAYLSTHEIDMRCGDFAEIVKDAGERSFVYFDPPYHGAAKTSFASYQAGGFDEDEQRRLRDLFAALTERGVPCLLSNADTPFIRALYQQEGVRIITVSARRPINSRAEKRGDTGEVLVKNW
jgi:DNA adenine methylase